MKKVITTASDFAIFKTECNKWLDKYNLRRWDVFFAHEILEEPRVAQATYSLEEMAVTLFLGKDWTGHKCGKAEKELRVTARHEVRELLLGRYSILAQYRYIAERELEEERHAIINSLECAE